MAFKDMISNLKFGSAIKLPSFPGSTGGSPFSSGIKISSPTPLVNRNALSNLLNSKLVIRK